MELKQVFWTVCSFVLGSTPLFVHAETSARLVLQAHVRHTGGLLVSKFRNSREEVRIRPSNNSVEPLWMSISSTEQQELLVNDKKTSIHDSPKQGFKVFTRHPSEIRLARIPGASAKRATPVRITLTAL